jgi:hypothetical protein
MARASAKSTQPLLTRLRYDCTVTGAVMSDLSVKKFQWLRNPKTWERNEVWRARQREARENFESANSAASNTFASAASNQVAGLSEIAARIASKRLQQKAIQSALNKLA